MTNGTNPQSNQPAQTAKKSKALFWILGGCLAFLVICGLAFAGFAWWGYHKAKNYVESAVEPGSMNKVAELWPDVPRMDGMNASNQIDMPIAMKVLAKPILDAMMRGVNDGADAGHWDWTAFTVSGKTTADVEAFYTAERMKSSGWKSEGGCMNMTPGGQSDQATLCSFQKEEGNKVTGILVISANDKETSAVSVFFIRQEGQKQQ